MLNAPRLAGQSAWYIERQLHHFKQGLRGANVEDSFGMQMAPMAATLADDAAIRNVAAYIASLPEPAARSGGLQSNSERGAKLYGTCKSCHGPEGQGIWALNAPRLQGLEGWYLRRQLENYSNGVRGAHPSDLYGKQMTLLTGMLRSEQDINDVVAHINQMR
jgi:cytochrome c oxidase subunit 2